MNSIILKSNNNFGLLFGVTSGGCNGFNFNLNLMDKNDYESIMKLKPNILTNDNVTLFIEPVSEIYIIGTTIDYVNEDYKKGIFENKFTYNVDKKLATSCGCGISFTPRNL